MRLVAKATFGGVDDPFKRQIIVRRHRQTEIAHGIANLQTFIEPWPADHPVRQADGQKPVFERPHLMRRAHQNGHIV